MSDVSKVDRIEVIDSTGRAYVKGATYGSPVKVKLSFQDDGKTLKVFVDDREAPEEKTHYFTFGQDHAHRLPNITMDKDIIIKITDVDPRKKMFDLFGAVWAMEYTSLEAAGYPEYYPRGIYDYNKKEVIPNERTK